MANISRSRKSGFTLRGGVLRRETQWFFGTDFSQNLASVSTAAVVTVLNAAALALRPFTVIRTRGRILVRSNQDAASENYGGAMGHCVVSDQASAIGITAVPTPVTDSGSDLWFQYDWAFGFLEFNSAVGSQDQGHLIEIDSKAMRKVEDGQTVNQVVESAANQTDGVNISGFSRLLIKLH